MSRLFRILILLVVSTAVGCSSDSQPTTAQPAPVKKSKLVKDKDGQVFVVADDSD